MRIHDSSSSWREGKGHEDDHLCIERIRRHLVTGAVGFQILLYREVASTSAVLRHLAEAGAADGAVVLAEAQSADRGPRGALWFSPAGVDLYVSVLFRPPIAPADVPVFSLIASLALSEALRAEGVPAEVRWPNEVLVEGKKVAGTLVSYAAAGDRVDSVILSVGVNVNAEEPTLAAALGPSASRVTSLRAATGCPVDRNVFAAALLNHLEKCWDTYLVSGPEAVLAAWSERAVPLRGQVPIGRGAPSAA